MAGRKCSLIKDIHDNTDMWRIVVRVLRRWNNYQKDSPSQLYAICFLLMDQEGAKIQASITNKSLFNQFQKYPVEGHCYFMANLEVIPNSKDYKAADHKFKLIFNSATYVREESADIPLHSFNFFPIKDILTQTVLTHTMSLFDVIGFVMSIGALEEYQSTTEVKNKLRLTLANERENTVQMVLYDDCALAFSKHTFSTMNQPIVLIAQLARIGFDERGQPEVCSSFHATKIQLNAEFPEVKVFIASVQKLPSPSITDLTPCFETQTSSCSAESLLRNTPRIKIAQIPHQEVGTYFAVQCEIKKFETRHGWFYDGCSRCGTKPRVTDGKAFCSSNYCKGKPCTIQSKLRLNYLIIDDSRSASIVFFDKHASEILKKSATQLKAAIPEEALIYEFPSEVNQLIGKKMILKMKLNIYNKQHLNSSVSVSSYAECTDLTQTFNEAASQAGQSSGLYNEEEDDIIFLKNATAKDNDPVHVESSAALSENFPTLEIDAVSLSDDISTLPSKGKRKVSAKKNVAKDSNNVSYGALSPAKSSSKPLKSIKQEKL